ncbi:MAG: hypothetical protein ACOZFS_14785 [Thermodesulfobacteriota bacterium]
MQKTLMCMTTATAETMGFTSTSIRRTRRKFMSIPIEGEAPFKFIL